jgi:hypothetical protein
MRPQETAKILGERFTWYTIHTPVDASIGIRTTPSMFIITVWSAWLRTVRVYQVRLVQARSGTRTLWADGVLLDAVMNSGTA